MPTDYLALMRAAVRQDLHDEDATAYRWTDAVLNRHIGRAVKEFSKYVPVEVKTTVATTANSRDISIGSATFADLIEVHAVEYPVDNFPPTYSRFSLWSTTLTLIGDRKPSGVEDAYIFWYKLHTIDASSSTLPVWAEDLVALGAAGYAALDWASYATNRVNAGGEAAWKHYLDFGNQRLDEFRSQLKLFGGCGSLRTSTLYQPSGPLPTQSTDPGP